jgi:hypothetical protein
MTLGGIGLAVAALNIPQRYRAGVSKISRLDERTVRDIRAALDKVIASGEASDVPEVNRQTTSLLLHSHLFLRRTLMISSK